jgi:3-oxoacyl-[acyl-carrier-protein] synthase II
MEASLAEGGLSPGDVDYVNAHATSTPIGDDIEVRAIRHVFGSTARSGQPLLVSSTKGSVGHLLGAAGAVEAVFAVMAMHTVTRILTHTHAHSYTHATAPTPTPSSCSPRLIPFGHYCCHCQGTVPATRNLVKPLQGCVDSEAAGIHYVRGAAAAGPPLHSAMSNSFGFGGTNCSLLFTRV